jgi:hypothetical protein
MEMHTTPGKTSRDDFAGVKTTRRRLRKLGPQATREEINQAMKEYMESGGIIEILDPACADTFENVTDATDVDDFLGTVTYEE